MILNDIQINAKRMISPFSSFKVSEHLENKVLSYGCSPFSYDITLADHDLKIFNNSSEYPIDPKRFNPDSLTDLNLIEDSPENYFLLPPKSYALGVSREIFSIPENILAIAVGKSTYARCGIAVNITPLEPGWKGYLTLEIYNANPKSAKVYANEGIAALVFFQGETPLQTYNGKYQNQEYKVVFAR